MNTQKNASVAGAPSFKLARVGKERKKKGFGLSWLRGGSPGNGSWAGAVGGSGAGGSGGLAALLAGGGKFLVIMAVSSLVGAAAIQVQNKNMKAQRAAAKSKPAVDQKAFAAKEPIKYEGDLSNLPSTKNTIPNSMGYVTGNAGGPSAEEIAAAAAAEEEAKKKAAEEEAKKKAEEEALAAAQQQDPNAAAPAPGNRLGSKFGQLSSSLGGKSSSLAGGAGMSGGMNRNFGAGGSLGGGRAMKTGTTSGYNMGSRANYGKGTRPGAGNASGRTLSRRQLARINTFSQQATSQSGENSASLAAAGWDGNSGEGNVITGAGVGNGQGPSATNPDSVDDGGPMGGGGGGGSGVGSTTTPKPKESEGDKYSWMLDIATGLLITVAVLAAFVIACNALNVFAGAGEAVKKALEACMLAVGLIVAGLGVAYMLMTGDTGGGGMLASITGGIIAAWAMIAGESLALGTQELVMLGGASLLGALGTQASRSKDTAGQQ